MKTQHNREEFVNDLLSWYDKNARILPWREDGTSYRVWVSEIMLQQTRVEAVKPFFERFIKTLPTLKDLAQASDDQLAKLWEGLGYYHRVRNMKKCAQYCVEHYQGELPSSYAELLALPGIGSYTAGAIASIAYQQKVPAVDGNVLRVFSRVLVSEDDILKEKTKKKFQDIIQTYIPKQRSGDFNQALMEIGAMVCVPNAAPRCNICPLQKNCIGYQSGQASFLPIKTAKKKRRIEKRTIVVIVHEDEVLLTQRPDTGLLAGLYEFENLEGHLTRKAVLEHVQEKGFKYDKIMKLHNAKHIFSHVEWHMIGYLIHVDKRNKDLWYSQKDLEKRIAIPTAFKAYREALITWWEVHKL